MNHRREATVAWAICLLLFFLVVPGPREQAWSQDVHRPPAAGALSASGVSDPAAPSAEAGALSIFVETDTWKYTVGDEVTITVTLTNNADSTVSGELEVDVQVAWPDAPGWFTVHTSEPRPISVAAHGEAQETYGLDVGQYKHSGPFRVVASVGEAVGYGPFFVAPGIELTLQVPDSVDVGQEFEVALAITNTLTSALSNIDVDVRFPTGSSLDPGSEHLVVPSLAAGDTCRHTWEMSVEEGGLNNLVAVATSEDGGSQKVVVSMDVLGEAALMPIVEDAVDLVQGSMFSITGEIHNTGGQMAEGVQVTLSLPSYALSTSEDLSVDVGDIPGGESRTVSWGVRALWPGHHGVELRVSDTAGHVQVDHGLVSVVGDPEADTGDLEELEPPDGSNGDGDGDGRCTEVDALLALQMAAGLEQPDVGRMDVTGDGQVTEVDALQILQWAAAGGQCGS